MSDLFDYLKWRGDLSFSAVDFNKIDALMLAQLSYLNFDGLLSESLESKKSLKLLAEEFKNATNVKERSDMGLVINPKTPDLLYACADSERFANVEICGFVSQIDLEREIQFAAMTFLVNGKVVVAYRGTDDTIVGWKEDFNIAYLDIIPGQEESLKYLNKVSEYFSDDIIILGHSKGGNLAVYSAVNFTKKDRIHAVYNFDGPGFSKEFFESEEFKKIEPKLKSVFPSFSVVGTIFYQAKDYEIIKSDQFAIMQHDALVWQIEGADFVHEKDFTEQSKLFHKAFNEWLEKLNGEDKKRFTRAVFTIIEASGYKTNSELNENRLAASAKMLSAFADMDKETKGEVHNIIRLLRHVVSANLPFLNIFNAQK